MICYLLQDWYDLPSESKTYREGASNGGSAAEGGNEVSGEQQVQEIGIIGCIHISI